MVQRIFIFVLTDLLPTEKLSDPNPDLKEYKTIAIKELENCLLNVITLCSKALGCCLPFCDVVVKRLTACNPDKVHE
jgi:hypothetical protein